MTKRYTMLPALVLALGLMLAAPAPSAAAPSYNIFSKPLANQQQEPVVRGILFWSSTCGHCHYVIDEVLPPLQEKYGEQLEIAMIEISTMEGIDFLYRTATSMGIPANEVGVPFMIIGEYALAGSVEIPERLPGLIGEYLALGGIDYPEIEGLEVTLGETGPSLEICTPSTACPEATTQAPASSNAPAQPSTAEPPEPAGPGGSISPSASLPAGLKSNGFVLAFAIMLGMVGAAGYSALAFARGLSSQAKPQKSIGYSLLIPALALIGLGVAGYLAYVETRAVEAMCGPIGDCNAVQSSPYAKLFGVLPVGVLGVAGYVAILAAWAWERIGSGRLARYSPLAVFGTSFVGVLFSIYLTYLEPFVIKAVCAWCLTSAVIMTLLMLLSLNPARAALQRSYEKTEKPLP